ncbi:hypothetical protein Tco_1070439 [Tanacetum coccineum]|uniref:Integrase, catalytic region, zinc finger, CCHC-type, peptidase aspartic, catalytic n=1 Tax=Tanacetum coccineum TaxID=301880 RepID=A0ABQ5HN89_9ASTR
MGLSRTCWKVRTSRQMVLEIWCFSGGSRWGVVVRVVDSLADVRSETHPSMLERGIERDTGATATTTATTQKEDDLTGDDLKQYEADIEAMNLILIAIPNDIYNYVNACENTKEIWDRVKRLMQGIELSKIERESQFINEFDKFTSEAK